jgi:hypothetical protein
VPQIEVTFDIDANGILSVTAKDKATNKQQSITISGASTLPKDEVERMVQDAEQNAAADKENDQQATADGSWGESGGRDRRAKASLRVDDKKEHLDTMFGSALMRPLGT